MPADRKRRWIQKAIKRPGALRRAAGKSGKTPLSAEELGRLEARGKRTGNTRLLRQVNLARTLRGFRKKKGGS